MGTNYPQIGRVEIEKKIIPKDSSPAPTNSSTEDNKTTIPVNPSTEDKKSTTSSTTPPKNTLRLVNITSPAARNETITCSVNGKPNTEYKISVFYSKSSSMANGLENATSDSSGNVSWSWKIGDNWCWRNAKS